MNEWEKISHDPINRELQKCSQTVQLTEYNKLANITLLLLSTEPWAVAKKLS